jgi:hypothetical protein
MSLLNCKDTIYSYETTRKRRASFDERLARANKQTLRDFKAPLTSGPHVKYLLTSRTFPERHPSQLLQSQILDRIGL